MTQRETSQFGKNPRSNQTAYIKTDRVDRVILVTYYEKTRLFNNVTCIIWILGREAQPTATVLLLSYYYEYFCVQ